MKDGRFQNTACTDQKKELAADSYLYLKMRPGETKEAAEKRLEKLLEDAGIEYQFFKVEDRDM